MGSGSGFIVTSSKDKAQNTLETFDWVLSAVKTYFWVFELPILSKVDKTLKTKVLYHLAIHIRHLAMIRMALMYIFFSI